MIFSQVIIKWYQKHKRDLPWRHTKDPYRIWLSEIILQQTKVQQGIPYYEAIISKFPKVHHLAKAKEDVIMKTWQGLGYYSRARNLHHTAKFISSRLNGKFPTTYNELRQLKGIGNYTASAIASFAFNKPHAVVDGNVFRVLSRYFGIMTPIDSSKGKDIFTTKANLLLDKANPGTFNQAIMEFGALQCVPQKPDCIKCPMKKSCNALEWNMVSVLPIKSQKVKTKTRYFNYLIIRKDKKILIKKRRGNDIWENLYDFPMIETNKNIKPTQLTDIDILNVSESFKQILSHQIIFAKFWTITGDYSTIFPENNINKLHQFVSISQLNKYAIPKLMENFIKKDLFFKNSINYKNI